MKKTKLQNFTNSMIPSGFAFEHIVDVYKPKDLRKDIQRCSGEGGLSLFFLYPPTLIYILHMFEYIINTV